MSRAEGLWRTDRELSRSAGGLRVVGIDEVGRGCLAGPVVACAALSPESFPPALSGIRDSKLLAPAARLRLASSLRPSGVAYALGWASPEEIDSVNILQATFLAMRRALERLMARSGTALSGALVVVDGNQRIAGLVAEQRPLIGGDGKSFAVACASVAAKAARDRWMRGLDRRHPGYGWAGNKGYGTSDHLEALARLGPSALHRRSFAPVSQVPLPLGNPCVEHAGTSGGARRAPQPR